MTRLLKLVIGWVLLAVAAAVQAQSPAVPDNHHIHSCQIYPFDGGTSVCTTDTYTNYRLWAGITHPVLDSTSHPARLFWRDSFGHAETATPTASARQIRIVHINGIATTRDDADNNLRAIMARVVEARSFLCNPVRGTLAYNRSRPDPLLGTPVNDLMEVAVQKHRENPNTRFSDMVRLVYLADTGATWLARSNIRWQWCTPCWKRWMRGTSGPIPGWTVTCATSAPTSGPTWCEASGFSWCRILRAICSPTW